MGGDLSQFLSGIGAGDVGFAALLSLAIYLILTGRLVPRATVEDMRSDYVSRIEDTRAEANDWKEAYQLEATVNGEQGRQIGELLEFARTSDHMIRSIQAAADQPKGGGA